MRGVTYTIPFLTANKSISTHTPHARRDIHEQSKKLTGISFQLTRLMRGVTSLLSSSSVCLRISTHTPHARRDTVLPVTRVTGTDISTHTPHARRDLVEMKRQDDIKISTHTPHARRDFPNLGITETFYKFQLTRLMRGVTANSCIACLPPLFQLTRLMRGVTSLFPDKIDRYVDFNSHASCEA